MPTEYHASTIAEIREHASEDNVVIYVDNDIDAGSEEWETLNIGRVTEIKMQGHKIIRPLIKENNMLFSGGTVREGKIINVFTKGGDTVINATNIIDCAISMRVSSARYSVFNSCVFSRCNVNVEIPNGVSNVFNIEPNRYPKDSLFTINGKLNGSIFSDPSLFFRNIRAAEGCRFDGKITGRFDGFISNTIPLPHDCIMNIDFTECEIAEKSTSFSKDLVWYNSDLYNSNNHPDSWVAVTSEQLRNPEEMKRLGLDVEIMG